MHYKKYWLKLSNSKILTLQVLEIISLLQVLEIISLIQSSVKVNLELKDENRRRSLPFQLGP